jgi:uncharacterized protein YeeX (DUF496 family)
MHTDTHSSIDRPLYAITRTALGREELDRLTVSHDPLVSLMRADHHDRVDEVVVRQCRLVRLQEREGRWHIVATVKSLLREPHHGQQT